MTLYYILIYINSHPPIPTKKVRTSQLSLLMRENQNKFERPSEGTRKTTKQPSPGTGQRTSNDLRRQPDKGPLTTFGGKARCAPLYTAQKATTALSRPGLRAGKRASMPQTLHTPSNRAFPPEPFN